MRIERAHRLHALLVAAWILSLLLPAGCAAPSTTPTPLPVSRATATPVQLPSFLIEVFPEPGGLVAQGEFASLVAWAVLRVEEITEPEEILQPRDVQERVELLVDGRPCDVEVFVFKSRVDVAGRFPLALGDHQATVRVRARSDQELEFSWSFTVAEEVTMPGLPREFSFVRPVPSSSITLQEYWKEPGISDYYGYGFCHVRGGLCVAVFAREIVEPGESLGVEEMLGKISFVALDGAPPDTEAVMGGSSELMALAAYDDKGNLVSQYPGPRQCKCWYTDLTPGRHEVTVRLERPSGNDTEFTWWFVITED